MGLELSSFVRTTLGHHRKDIMAIVQYKELNKEQSLKLVFSSFLGEKSEIVFLQRFLDI